MALDRQSVEKKDFPIGRRGYEPEAVDAHLAALADEIEQLKRSGGAARPGSESMALAASEQVRAIVEAAESSADQIERQAREEAARIRRDAESDATSTRDDAVSRSEEHVAGVSAATQLMLQRVDAMESEVGALLESLRTGANRLNADLTLLQGNMGDLYDAAGGAPPEQEAPAPVAPVQEPEPEPMPEPTPVAPHAPEVPDSIFPTEPVHTPEPPEVAEAAAPPAPAGDGGDIEGARLIALNMALNGSPREETDRYLAENFDLADRDALLDEVYDNV